MSSQGASSNDMKFSYQPSSPSPFWSKTGRIAAKLLGIKLDDEETDSNRVTRGESVISAYSHSEDAPPNYFQADPTVIGWIKEHIPDRQQTKRSVLFPSLA
jgi:hypothetical protein